MQIENRTFSPAEVVRLITTATLLNSAASEGILGVEMVAKAFRSPLDGIVDAVADAIAARMQAPTQMPSTEVPIGIRDSAGEPLNPACATVCDAGTGVQSDEMNVGVLVCTRCLPGSFSVGGKAAKCQSCQPGPFACLCVCLYHCLLPAFHVRGV